MRLRAPLAMTALVLLAVGLAGPGGASLPEHEADTVPAHGEEAEAVAIAVSGARALVGVPTADGDEDNQGVVLDVRFNSTSGRWERHGNLSVGGPANARFGAALDVDGDRAVIASPGDGEGQAGPGKVWFYRFEGDAWVLDGAALSAYSEDGLTLSVDLKGTRAAAGAPRESGPGGEPAAGRIYVYQRGAVWFQADELTAPDAAAQQNLGADVSFGGANTAASTDLLAGAPGTTVDGVVDAGRLHVFVLDGSDWVHSQAIDAETGQGELGWQVAAEGDRALVGAPRTDVGASADAGKVLEFRRNAGTGAWEHSQDLPTDASAQRLGERLAWAGAYAAVGMGDSNGVRVMSRSSPGAWTVEGDLTQAGAATEGLAVGPYEVAAALDGGASDAVLWQWRPGGSTSASTSGSGSTSTSSTGTSTLDPNGDADGDGVANGEDACPGFDDRVHHDGDQVPDGCDADDDGDTIPDAGDNCPLVANGPQRDNDEDGIGDLCDDDVSASSTSGSGSSSGSTTGGGDGDGGSKTWQIALVVLILAGLGTLVIALAVRRGL